jgi:hypothetical protein
MEASWHAIAQIGHPTRKDSVTVAGELFMLVPFFSFLFKSFIRISVAISSSIPFFTAAL